MTDADPTSTAHHEMPILEVQPFFSSTDIIDQVMCNHTDFGVHLEVVRAMDGATGAHTRRVARVRLWCNGCKQPFYFCGVAPEASETSPNSDTHCTQVNLPIAPYYGLADKLVY